MDNVHTLCYHPRRRRRFTLQGILFEWDRAKEAVNQRKHGVDFTTACEVFFDPFLRTVDGEVRGGERRQAVVGLSRCWQLLFVVYVDRAELLRIVSARPASAAERRTYEDL
jgi:uncharacterized DUF497 family protein